MYSITLNASKGAANGICCIIEVIILFSAGLYKFVFSTVFSFDN